MELTWSLQEARRPQVPKLALRMARALGKDRVVLYGPGGREMIRLDLWALTFWAMDFSVAPDKLSAKG